MTAILKLLLSSSDSGTFNLCLNALISCHSTNHFWNLNQDSLFLFGTSSPCLFLWGVSLCSGRSVFLASQAEPYFVKIIVCHQSCDCVAEYGKNNMSPVSAWLSWYLNEKINWQLIGFSKSKKLDKSRIFTKCVIIWLAVQHF